MEGFDLEDPTPTETRILGAIQALVIDEMEGIETGQLKSAADSMRAIFKDCSEEFIERLGQAVIYGLYMKYALPPGDPAIAGFVSFAYGYQLGQQVASGEAMDRLLVSEEVQQGTD